MAAMRRVLTYVTVWSGATALAMLLVWVAARPVLHNAVFGEPPARPVVAGSATLVPTPSTRSPGDSSTVATASPSPSGGGQPNDHTYVTRGGRVIVSLTPTAARLVSATPNPGYEVSTWHSEGLLRVDFRRGRHVSSVFVTWNGHAPDVQVHG